MIEASDDSWESRLKLVRSQAARIIQGVTHARERSVLFFVV